MAWVLCGYISLQKDMPPYSHVQQLNNCKQPDLESPCPKLSNGICLQNSPGGGGRVLLAGPRTILMWSNALFSSLQYCKYRYFTGIATNKNNDKSKTKTLRYNLDKISIYNLKI